MGLGAGALLLVAGVILTYGVDFQNNTGRLDPRMGVAMTVLLLAIEGRQEGR